MALRTPPSWLQNGSHPAENDRLTTQAIWKTTGIVNSTDMAVSQSGTPGMSISIASGWAAIVGTTQTNMGTYVAYNDAATTVVVTTADPTNARIDKVVATIADAYYTGSTNTVTFSIVAGTPSASPATPATPANSISLATLAIAANATSVVTANITDTRVLATSPFTVGTNAVVNGLIETANIVASAATGTINVNVSTSSIWYYTSNATANFTLNYRSSSSVTLNTLMAIGQSITVVFLNTNGATAYYPTAYQIDGSSVTPKWVASAAPTSGNASSIDAYSATILKTAASTYTVFNSQTRFA